MESHPISSPPVTIAASPFTVRPLRELSPAILYPSSVAGADDRVSCSPTTRRKSNTTINNNNNSKMNSPHDNRSNTKMESGMNVDERTEAEEEEATRGRLGSPRHEKTSSSRIKTSLSKVSRRETTAADWTPASPTRSSSSSSSSPARAEAASSLCGRVVGPGGDPASPAVLAAQRLDDHTRRQLERELTRAREASRAAAEKAAGLMEQLQRQRHDHQRLHHQQQDTAAQLADWMSRGARAEESLAAERKRVEELQRARQKSGQRLAALQQDVDRLQRQLAAAEETAAAMREEANHWETAVSDRRRFIPVGEMERRQVEWRRQQHESIMAPLQQLFLTLSLDNDAAQTRLLVAKRRVLDAARSLEDRLAHSEATLVALKEYWSTYQSPLEAQTTAVMTRVAEENRALYETLGRMEREAAAQEAALAQRLPRSECVTLTQHEEEMEAQAELYDGRLAKAQELLQAQTLLIRQHEEAMEEMMAHQQHLTEKMKEAEAAALEEQRRVTADVTSTREALEEVRREREEERTMAEQERQRWAARETALQTQVEATQRLLQETTETAEALQSELTRQAATQAAFREAWATELKQLQEDQASAVEVLSSRYEQQQQTLEAACREAQEAASAAASAREVAESRAVAAEEHGTALADRLHTVEMAHEALRSASVQWRETEQPALLQERDTLQAALAAAQQEAAAASSRATEAMAASASAATALEEAEASWRRQRTDLTAQWEAAERGRAALQTALDAALTRVSHLELEMDGDRQRGRDRATLLEENERLQAALAEQAAAHAGRHEAIERDRCQSRLQEELEKQRRELEAQLGALPALQETVRQLEAAARAGQVELEALRQERDALAARVKSLVQRRAAASQQDEALEKALQEAGDVIANRMKTRQQQQQQQQQSSASTAAATTALPYTLSSARKGYAAIGAERRPSVSSAPVGAMNPSPPLSSSRTRDAKSGGGLMPVADVNTVTASPLSADGHSTAQPKRREEESTLAWSHQSESTVSMTMALERSGTSQSVDGEVLRRPWKG